MKLLIAFLVSVTACTAVASPVQAKSCNLSPRKVAEQFFDSFYVKKQVRAAFETWVAPGYIQHNPMAATGRDAAIGFLEPFFAANPDIAYSIKRIVAEGNLVVVHSQGRFSASDRGSAVVDIVRIEGCKVVEHWDVVQPIPERSLNDNTMF